MKRTILNLFLLIGTFLLMPNTVFSQEWTWDEPTTITAQTKGSMMEAMHVDQYNNIYCRIPYSGPIYIGDTSFNYGDPNGWNDNYVFAKYNTNGEFQFAIDIHDGDIHYPEIVTDQNQNIYIAGDFNHHIFVNDSLIIMNQGSSGFHGEVLLCKINPNNEVVWTGLISNQWDDQINSLCLASDNNALYLATEHYANGDPHILNYFNQDTSLPFFTNMNTLVKVDTNCNILWKKEIRSEYQGTHCRKVFNGLDNNLYFFGSGFAHFYVDEDTIYHPYIGSGEVVSLNWLIKFDHEGSFLDGFYLDWDIWSYEMEVDFLGNLYVTGTIVDTAVIGQDTIIVPDGLYYRIIGKFDQDLQPDWYNVFEEQDNQTIYFRELELDQDQVIFAGNVNGDFPVGDTTFHFGTEYTEAMVGEYNPDGELVYLLTSQCEEDFSMWHMILDNCKNPIISGMFKGEAILGSNILSPFSNDYTDGYFAKIIRNEPESINLGSDTIVCESLILQAPEGYSSYVWNNQIGGQNTLEVTETGDYTLACGDINGCWIYDTIQVSVDFADELYLGADTSIKENDTIIFEVIGNFDEYLWSDSSISNHIEIIGLDYGIGIHEIWVRATKESCIRRDTILLEVKSESGLNDKTQALFQVIPNPFTNSFVILVPMDTQQIAIYRLDGSLIQNIKFNNLDGNSVTCSLIGEPAGIYLIKITTKEGSLSGKLMKI